jgi:hypothetical protein
MPTTGEKPGKGTYKCTKDGQLVTLDDNSDVLPLAQNATTRNLLEFLSSLGITLSIPLLRVKKTALSGRFPMI